MGGAQSSVSMVIIDDNPGSLEFLSAALARPGLEIFTATRPEDGLALVAAWRPVVVLTDMVMPGLSGLDVLQRVKQLDPGIDVVLMSAREDAQAERNALQQAAGYLRKPIPLLMLREIIGQLFDKRPALGRKPLPNL